RTESLLKQMTRKRAHVSVLDGISFVEKIVPVDNNGPVIGSFNLRDQVRHQPVGHGKFRMLGNLPTKLEIFRGVWFAIVPRETGSEFIHRYHGLLLGVDLPRCLSSPREALRRARGHVPKLLDFESQDLHRPSTHARSRADCDILDW